MIENLGVFGLISPNGGLTQVNAPDVPSVFDITTLPSGAVTISFTAVVGQSFKFMDGGPSATILPPVIGIRSNSDNLVVSFDGCQNTGHRLVLPVGLHWLYFLPSDGSYIADPTSSVLQITNWSSATAILPLSGSALFGALASIRRMSYGGGLEGIGTRGGLR